MTTELKNSIDNLHTTFSSYRGNRNMEGSPMYGDKINEWNRQLYVKNTHSLTDDDLALFVDKALSTWGETDDYKHFLPRILELIATNETTIFDVTTAIGKLEYAQWSNWKPKEQKAINDYLTNLFLSILDEKTDVTDLSFSEHLISIIGVCNNLNELLSIWEKRFHENGISCLCDVIIELNKKSGHHTSIFIWAKEKGEKNISEFKQWTISATVKQILEQIFIENKFPAILEKLVETLELIENTN